MAGNPPSLEIDPAQELQFSLSTSDANPKVTMTLSHPGNSQESFAFKVKTTQPRRYLVRPNQGLIAPGGTETVQILLVEKDKKGLLQSYQRLGQTALDHSKDKFLVQSCVVSKQFAQEYSAGDEGSYDKLSSMWASVTSGTGANSTPIANKKLHVRHVVSDGNAGAGAGGIDHLKSPASPAALENMSSEQLTAELTNLRRKYDELVAFSVNLTAERDILNNTLEQTKRDLNRELSKHHGGAAARGGATNSSAPASSKGFGLSSLLTLLFVGFCAFCFGVRMEVQGGAEVIKSLPVVGGFIEGVDVPAGAPTVETDGEGEASESSEEL